MLEAIIAIMNLEFLIAILEIVAAVGTTAFDALGIVVAVLEFFAL